MKITKLEQQKKNRNKYNLFIDDNFVAGIGVNIISDFDLYDGKEVERDILIKISEKNELDKAIAKIFDYYSRRLHSEKEIREKLRGKFLQNTINTAVAKFIELGYINDEQFAEAWVESRMKTKGKRVLRFELRNKGIEEDTIARLLGGIEPENEYERALALVAKKRWSEMNKEERFTKIGGFLARKGFDYETIKQVLKETEQKTSRNNPGGL